MQTTYRDFPDLKLVNRFVKLSVTDVDVTLNRKSTE